VGKPLGLKTVTIVGGMDMMTQARELEARPHIIVATPGRLCDLLRSEGAGNGKLSRVKVMVSGVRRCHVDNKIDGRFLMRRIDCSHPLLHRSSRICSLRSRRHGRLVSSRLQLAMLLWIWPTNLLHLASRSPSYTA